MYSIFCKRRIFFIVFILYKMERLVEMKIAKFNILSILDCYYRLFPLIYISYYSEGIKAQGSCEDRKILATTAIPRDSFESYECEESMVIAVPLHLGKLGGRCVSIEVLKMDSWRVKNVFKSNDGVSYEAISSYTFKLMDHPKITESMGSRSGPGTSGPISFGRYPSTKKFLSCVEDLKGEVEVEVNGGGGGLQRSRWKFCEFQNL